MDNIIFNNVSKQYNNRLILDNISHSFKLGKSYTFVGHNGCGKSTLLRIISGLTVPDGGTVEYTRPFHFAFVPEKFKPVNLTGREYLSLMCEIDGIPKKASNKQIENLAGDFFLSEMLDIPMKSMSKGTLQKIGVIQAILKKPDILLLDQPLSGQDAESQKVFVNKINDLRSQGMTVFMSCHEKWIMEALSDEIYEVSGKKLVPYICHTSHRYYLLFDNPDYSGNIPDITDGDGPQLNAATGRNAFLYTNLKRFGTGYRICVDEDKVKETIEMMWNEGFTLKGMCDENNQND